MIFYLRIHGFPYPDMLRDFIQKLEYFHENNAGSVYMILTYLHLSMQKKNLKKKDMILPLMLIVGDMATAQW